MLPFVKRAVDDAHSKMASVSALFLYGGVISTFAFAAAELTFDQPQCSKYSFEEKILEKLVRMDHKVELMEEKLKEFEQTLKAATAGLQGKQEALEATEKELISKVTDSVSQAETNVSRVVEDVQKQLENMTEDIARDRVDINHTLGVFLQNAKSDIVYQVKDDVGTPNVAFFARNVADVSPSSDSVIRFTMPVVNIPKAYDPSTGYFTAPYLGVYMFTVTICTYSKKYIDVRIVVDDVELAGFRQIENSAYDGTCTSSNAMAVLKAGSKAWIKCSSRASRSGRVISVGGKSFTSSFSGTLLFRVGVYK